MNLNVNIKEIRESKRLKQIEVSDALNMDNSQYAKFEKRGKKLSLEQIENLSQVLGVSIYEILGIEEKPTITSEDKDKEIEELKKRVAELERNNNLLEANSYILEEFSRKFIKGHLDLSYEISNKRKIISKDSSEKLILLKGIFELKNESRKLILDLMKDLSRQGFFKIILRKYLIENKEAFFAFLEIAYSLSKTKDEVEKKEVEAALKLLEGAKKTRKEEEVIDGLLDVVFPLIYSMGS